MNAVSESPNSCAILSNFSFPIACLGKQTPAGFPLNGSLVNESTIYVFIGVTGIYRLDASMHFLL